MKAIVFTFNPLSVDTLMETGDLTNIKVISENITEMDSDVFEQTAQETDMVISLAGYELDNAPEDVKEEYESDLLWCDTDPWFNTREDLYSEMTGYEYGDEMPDDEDQVEEDWLDFCINAYNDFYKYISVVEFEQ